MSTLLDTTSAARARAGAGALCAMVAGLLLGACASDGGAATPRTSYDGASSITTTIESAVTTSVGSDSTPGSGSTLTVMAIGDSFVAWSSWPELYASEAEAALGRPIELDLSLAVAGGGPRLDAIRDSSEARSKIGEADIIVIQPQPGFAAAPPMRAYLNGTCGGDQNTECFATAAAEYEVYLDEYLDLITSLVAEDAPIRLITTGTWAMDAFNPHLRAQEPEKLHDLIGLVDALMAIAESEARERSITVVDVNTAFNGADHRDPAPDDYLIGDRIHLAEAGSEVVARMLTAAGFAPLDDVID